MLSIPARSKLYLSIISEGKSRDLSSADVFGWKFKISFLSARVDISKCEFNKTKHISYFELSNRTNTELCDGEHKPTVVPKLLGYEGAALWRAYQQHGHGTWCNDIDKNAPRPRYWLKWGLLYFREGTRTNCSWSDMDDWSMEANKILKKLEQEKDTSPLQKGSKI